MKNNFPVQDSVITLNKKIEKMIMFKANLNPEILNHLLRAVPNDKVQTFIFKNMYGLL